MWHWGTVLGTHASGYCSGLPEARNSLGLWEEVTFPWDSGPAPPLPGGSLPAGALWHHPLGKLGVGACSGLCRFSEGPVGK